MATISLQVAAGNDDAREVAGTMYLNEATGIVMPASSPGTWAATRFTGVTVPPGSIIDVATYQLDVYTTSNDSPDVNVLADDADNSAQPTAAANNLSGRTPTTAAVIWTANNIGTGWKSPADLSAVIQEIIDRAGWASGNAITILLDARSVNNDFRFRSYEYGAANAAKLDITYTPPGGGGHAHRKVSAARLVSKVGGGLAWCI
jgi:hypothetical protein